MAFLVDLFRILLRFYILPSMEFMIFQGSKNEQKK